jgi:hypothetical protein
MWLRAHLLATNLFCLASLARNRRKNQSTFPDGPWPYVGIIPSRLAADPPPRRRPLPPRTAVHPLPVDSSLRQARRRILARFRPAAAVPPRLPVDYPSS